MPLRSPAPAPVVASLATMSSQCSSVVADVPRLLLLRLLPPLRLLRRLLYRLLYLRLLLRRRLRVRQRPEWFRVCATRSSHSRASAKPPVPTW